MCHRTSQRRAQQRLAVPRELTPCPGACTSSVSPMFDRAPPKPRNLSELAILLSEIPRRKRSPEPQMRLTRGVDSSCSLLNRSESSEFTSVSSTAPTSHFQVPIGANSPVPPLDG